MKKLLCIGSIAFTGLLTSLNALATENTFLGQWALNPAAGGAGWLEIKPADGSLTGTLLWMGGSPEPQTRVWMDGDKLVALRVWNENIRDSAGKIIRTLPHPAILTATLTGDQITGTLSQPSNDGTSVWRDEFAGVRIPPAPPKPDLSTIRFSEPIQLFNGTNLEGWA
ncbi:MAG: DUF1080 domain-containing protein, partial [Verrucomicrobiota bacterium]